MADFWQLKEASLTYQYLRADAIYARCSRYEVTRGVNMGSGMSAQVEKG
jgi:hypothetical protein